MPAPTRIGAYDLTTIRGRPRLAMYPKFFQRGVVGGTQKFSLRQPKQAVSTGSRLGNEQPRVGAALLDSSYGRTAVDLEFRS